MLQKENNPWVGLASYKRQDAARFYGREKETRLLSELIQANYCTILYGKSGAGKTSLIQAGVCPLLADARYLPLSMKLTHDGSTPYARQIIDRIEEALQAVGGEVEYPVAIPEGIDEESRAWLFFHTANFWDGQNFRVIPAVFIDQFEELFNLTDDISLVGECFRTIDTILQMTPPEKVSDAFARLNARLPFNDKPAFRLILSLREDFLARLEDYSYNIPALRRNRVGLASMNGLQALEVITRPIPGLVERDAALKILSKVTATEIKDNEYFLERLSVDSCILSLFCTEIYDKSAESGKDSITMDVIDQFGNDIIQQFYRRNMEDISPASARYLESILLTTNGFRNLVALEDLAPKHVQMDELRKLEENRIIRIETINGTERVEFTHDVLCKVAMDHQKAIHAKGEKNKTVRFYAALAFEVLLNYGVFARFIHGTDYDSLSIIRDNPALFVILAGGLLLSFLVRLEHHCKKYRSLVVMGLAAVFSWIAFYFVIDTSTVDLSDTGVWLLFHALSGTAYLFIEAALRFPNRNGLFLSESFRFWKDRPRLLSVLAFLTLCFISLSLVSHKVMNGTLGTLLLLTLPVLLVGWAHLALFHSPDTRKPKRSFFLAAEAGTLLLALSPYCCTKVWYYLALGILAFASLYAAVRIPGEKRYGKLLGGAGLWLLAFFLLPTYILGFNIPSLGKLARVPRGTIITESLPRRMMKVRDRSGARGVFYAGETLLPTEYEDIRLYAKSYFTKYPSLRSGTGSIREITFYVKDFGEKEFRELPLSQSPGSRNSLTLSMAEDWSDFLVTADSLFRREQKALLDSAGNNSASGNSVDVSLTNYWKPFLSRYDPDIYLSLATHVNPDSTFVDVDSLVSGKTFYARQYIVHTLMTALTSGFLEEGDWYQTKESLQGALLFEEFYRRTGISKTDLFHERFRKEILDDRTFRSQIDSLSGWLPGKAVEKIMDNPDWRSLVYEALTDSSNRAQWFRLLSLRTPEINDLLSRLIGLEEESPINSAFYALFLGRYDEAESLSRKAVETEETFLERNTALSNLIPALFLGGKEQEAHAVLDTTAYHHTGSGSVLADVLHQDIRNLRLHGALSPESPQYSRYLNLVNSYLKEGYRDYQSTNGSDHTAIYYKGLERSDTYIVFQDAFLFFDAPPATPVFRRIMIPWDEDIALVIDDQGAKGYYDLETGREIYPVRADHAWIFSEGKGVLETDGRLRVIDTEGNPAFEATFPDPRDYRSPTFTAVDFVFHDGLCPMVGGDGRFGLIDTNGTWVLAPEYDYVTNPDEDGYRHLLKDGDLFLLETAEIGRLVPVPSEHPIIIEGRKGINLWDPRGKRQLAYYTPQENVRFLSGRDYRHLLIGDGNRLVTYDHGQVTESEYLGYSLVAVLSPDRSKSIHYNSLGGHAYLYDARTGEEIATLPVDPDEELVFQKFVFNQSGNAAVSLRSDALLQIWEIPSGKCLYAYDLEDLDPDTVIDLSLSHDGRSAVLTIGSYTDNVIYCRIGQEPVVRSPHSDYVRSVRFSHDGKWFVTCSDDATIVRYDSATGRPVQTIRTDRDTWLYELAVSPDDRRIAAGDRKGRISIWDIGSGRLLDEIFTGQDMDEADYHIYWSE